MSTKNQKLMDEVHNAVRPKKKQNIPVVLPREEVVSVISLISRTLPWGYLAPKFPKESENVLKQQLRHHRPES